MANYYDELLKLCGFEDEEIEKERPRIEKAFEKLEFTPEDIYKAEKRVKQYFSVELSSIRKMLGLWIQCLIDLVLAKEEREKIIYCAMPPFASLMNAMAMVSEDIYVSPPDIVLSQTVGGIFDKLNPIMEAAEGDLLPANGAFCGGIQAKLGAIIKGVIPVPDFLVSTGFVCDQTPKVDELIGEQYGIPVAYIDSTQDEIRKNWPQVSVRRTKYLYQEAQDALKTFEEVTSYIVTEDIAQRSNLRAIDLAMRCSQLFELMRKADPQPISFADVGSVSRLVVAVNTTTLYKDMEGLLDLLNIEMKEILDKGEGILPKGVPRVALDIIWSDPAPMNMIEKTGLAVVIDLGNGLVPTELERVPPKHKDFWERAAELVLRFSGTKFGERKTQMCKESGVDGLILNYAIGCRDLNLSTLQVRELITKECRIPVLLVEANHADTRNYSAEAMRSRVEAFAEMLKAAKAAKAK
jgi:benzoyl-CoA reductase/2-hydroxyglutaryl-CoA dehydratase subunit BcrC/BadD/HgdB